VTILVTGANGFIGRRLVHVLLSGGAPDGVVVDRLRLLDRSLDGLPQDDRVERIAGDLTDPTVVERAFAGGVDHVFHLASVPGGAAEQHFELGLQVNLQGTVALLEAARRQGRAPRFVFASTIGVFGVPMPSLIDESTVPEPAMSYGAQKYVGEVLVADYTRRGFVDGASLRLPGIVARPAAQGMLSIFVSDLIRNLTAGRPYVCPVSAGGHAWWMSRTRVVENLLHAATLPRETLRSRRFWLLPVQHASMAAVVEALARVYGADRRGLVTYAPNEPLEAQFARMPPLRCPAAEAAGFRHDGTLDDLVVRALDGPE
jgi:nucleoside-diphosphate-sugar epimerase